MNVTIVSGDIARVPADALITAINSGGMWFGGIDGVIQRNAGNSFHNQARAASPLKHGQAVVANGNGATNKGAFKNVVFVVDDLQGKLRQIVFNGLTAAHAAGFKSVSLPTIRMGVMLGQVEKSPEEAIGEIVGGIRQFRKTQPDSQLKQLTFVVYNDPMLQSIAEQQLPFTDPRVDGM